MTVPRDRGVTTVAAAVGTIDDMIEVIGLTKRYGGVCAVDALSFTAAPGRVTGFLGANGSGKTTTMRMLLGLVAPTAGRALIGGQVYQEIRNPLRRIGAVLEQGVAHPGQTGRAHLRTQAIFADADCNRVDQVLAHVGLTDAADRRVGGYSLGMRQRLSVATALLGAPDVLVLDEPANGLDPEGIAWLRLLLRMHAEAGGTVLISSHILSELAQLVDDVVVIAHGRLVRQAPLGSLTGDAPPTVTVRGSDPERLRYALGTAGGLVAPHGDLVNVVGLTVEQVGRVAYEAGVVVYELSVRTVDLEAAFLEMVGRS
jgi:ABC-2 type transport system ATP-binding protein